MVEVGRSLELTAVGIEQVECDVLSGWSGRLDQPARHRLGDRPGVPGLDTTGVAGDFVCIDDSDEVSMPRARPRPAIRPRGVSGGPMTGQDSGAGLRDNQRPGSTIRSRLLQG